MTSTKSLSKKDLINLIEESFPEGEYNDNDIIATLFAASESQGEGTKRQVMETLLFHKQVNTYF